MAWQTFPHEADISVRGMMYQFCAACRIANTLPLRREIPAGAYGSGCFFVKILRGMPFIYRTSGIAAAWLLGYARVGGKGASSA